MHGEMHALLATSMQPGEGAKFCASKQQQAARQTFAQNPFSVAYQSELAELTSNCGLDIKRAPPWLFDRHLEVLYTKP